MKDSSIYIVIPAYNEETVIASVISDLQNNGYEKILVVDDASTDATGRIASDTGAEVLRHIINRGQGGSLKTGIEYLSEVYSPDIIVTFDGDGQHQAKNIAALIKPLIENRADIVLGSRFLTHYDSIPLVRKIILKLGVLFTNALSHTNLTDTHNGFRALNKKAFTNIQITHRGMEHASDIINEIIPRKLRYKEVPVHIVYTPYSLNKGQRGSNFIKLGMSIIFNRYFS